MDAFRTTDIGCAAALICTGHQIVGIESDRNPNRGLFKFENSEEIQKAAEQYVFGGLRVDPLRFTDTTRMLKGRLHDLRQNNGTAQR